MGRYYPNAKRTVEESCDLTIYDLRKMGMLVGRASMVITWVHSRTNKETNIGLIVDKW